MNIYENEQFILFENKYLTQYGLFVLYNSFLLTYKIELGLKYLDIYMSNA